MANNSHQRHADFLRDLHHPLAGDLRGVVRVLVAGVQLDRHPPVVVHFLERLQGRAEVDRALAGDQVVVDPRRGDVFEVDVPDELAEPADRVGRDGVGGEKRLGSEHRRGLVSKVPSKERGPRRQGGNP